jgi:hypothetical protein
MKKNLLFIAAVIMLFVADGFAQVTQNTGAMQIYVSGYGKFRLLTIDDTRQLDRASILVGTSASAVFDFNNDVNTIVVPTELVASPLSSDYEITGTYGRDASSSLPDVEEKVTAYGWVNAAYSIVKFNIKNLATEPITANIGLDIIPQLNGGYEDTISYNQEEGVIRYHFGAGVQNMGIKLLSASLSTLYSFTWYDGYEVDADYWTWMNYGTLQPMCASPINDPEAGTVTITSQAPMTIPAGESATVLYAFALGDNEQAMLSNIAAAKLKYDGLFASVTESKAIVKELGNYPNPVTSSTKISYQLPGNGFVDLRVYDALGNELTVLVNEKQTSGLHTIDFNATDLTSGVYSYRLLFNNQVVTNKMVVVK